MYRFRAKIWPTGIAEQRYKTANAKANYVHMIGSINITPKQTIRITYFPDFTSFSEINTEPEPPNLDMQNAFTSRRGSSRNDHALVYHADDTFSPSQPRVEPVGNKPG